MIALRIANAFDWAAKVGWTHGNKINAARRALWRAGQWFYMFAPDTRDVDDYHALSFFGRSRNPRM